VALPAEGMTAIPSKAVPAGGGGEEGLRENHWQRCHGAPSQRASAACHRSKQDLWRADPDLTPLILSIAIDRLPLTLF